MSVDPALIAATLAPVHTFGYELWVQWDGVTFVNETPYVLSLAGVESVDPNTRALNAAEVNVELDNATRRYDPDNAAGPLYSYLTHPGQKAYIRLGYNGILAKIGTFWIDSLTPTESTRGVSMRLLDRLATLARLQVNYGPSSAVRLDNVARGLLVAAGLTEGVHFVLDVAETTAVWAVAVAASPVAELADLAIAEGGRVYVDVDGVLRFLNRESHRALLATPVASFVRSLVAYDLSYARRQQGQVSRVLLAYEDRVSALVDETVYDQKTPVALPTAYGWTTFDQVPYTVMNGSVPVTQYNSVPRAVWYPGSVTLQIKGQDLTRWEREFPLLFTTMGTIAANTKADGTGTALAVHAGAPPAMTAFTPDVYYVLTPNGSTADLVLYNVSGAPAFVTTMKVNGKPAREASPWSIVADDRDAQDLFGIIPQSISNAYLPNADVATIRAQDILFFRSGVRTRIDIPALDGVPFLHPFNAFAFVDDSTSPPVTTYLQVIRNEWRASDAGYTCSLYSAPALPPTERVLPDVVPPPTDGALATAVDSGPWTWGPAGHPLMWDWTQWT
jgi:hypothetical protein